MNNEEKYTKYALSREMMETAEIIRKFKQPDFSAVLNALKQKKRLFMTGEGSSRIFPAKYAGYTSMRAGLDVAISNEGGRQAGEYDLGGQVVFAASNSGSTKEVIWLLDRLNKVNHSAVFGLTARENTRLAEYAKDSFVLSCGWEQAVAATKSVAEQALFYQSLLAAYKGGSIAAKLAQLSEAVDSAMKMDIDGGIIERIAGAGTIYFAGRNDGVAEELTLKTNEITRKKSDYLEGTYAVHGIEEVMNADDVVIVINPFGSEAEKFKEVLIDGVGLDVFAVSDEDTIFPTIKIPDIGELAAFVYLAAGWNILVETGLALNIDLDKPERARKVGNEFTG